MFLEILRDAYYPWLYVFPEGVRMCVAVVELGYTSIWLVREVKENASAGKSVFFIDQESLDLLWSSTQYKTYFG